MFYPDISSVIYTVLIWWVILLVFQRLTKRYPQKNTWKKDLIITLFQSIMIMILFPIITYLLKSFGLN
ncbi:hypothetical protein NEOCIP111885_01356 [Pseudoneobacillus rhizosphaerae]|uniref:Uncharacterized protein n=1 Tax=Pseudoneobacillus rhizosphaerae TaxID=2880968 RepID=A0A9C7G8B3_9BACI|nr:hypothetical protein NEOCIP111885_01356 [Pseudoneobacillus rhizosphaerae]